ncbi:MAG: right-handed parallel beta-helix repeat-containing protein [Planctomycetota bacterium]|jgi:hypothetical protein|nr:right-handed parallel beta-helix repeat-containing protein [Planctomycetota bacterium]
MTISIYCAAQGNDEHPGSSEQPVRSPTRAQELARAARASHPDERVEVLLAGRLSLDAPLVFTANDGGTEAGPTVWRAAPGERALLSGAVAISDWTVTERAGRRAWVAPLPAGLEPTQLWSDGQRRLWPQGPWQRFSDLDGQGDSGFNWMRGPQRIGYPAGSIDATWHQLNRVRLTCWQLWFETHHRVASVDAEKQLVHFRAPSIGSLIDENGDLARFRAENVFEYLSEPGTWYADCEAQQLWYLPTDDEDPTTTRIEVATLDHLLHVDGSREAPVRHLRFEHLDFAYVEFDRAANNPGTVQAAYDVPGALRLGWAEHCALYRCRLAHLGGYAIHLLPGTHRVTIAGCTMHDLGAGGVRIDNEELNVHESAVGSNAGLVRPEPTAATICDCIIRDGGHRFAQAVGIMIGNAGHIQVRHNLISDIPYTGVSCGWTWGYKPTRTIGSKICDNRIQRINADGLLSDNGAIYTLGRQPGGEIAGNWIETVGCFGYGGWGIYPDEGSSEFDIHHNVVLDTKHAAFHMHFGSAVHIHDNLFAGSRAAHVKLSRAEDHRSLRFEHNVFAVEEGAWESALTAPSEHILWRNNLIHDQRGPVFTADALREQHRAGQHRGLDQRDPLLHDPAGGQPEPRSDGPGKRAAAASKRASKAGVRAINFPLSFDDYKTPRSDDEAIIETRITIGEAEQTNADRRIPATIHLRNVGTVPATGHATIKAGPRGVCIEGDDSATVALQAGEQRSIAVTMIAGPKHERAELHWEARAGALRSHLAYTPLAVAGRTVDVPAVTAGALEDLAAALEPLPMTPLRYGPRGVTGGRLRLGHDGTSLALRLQVRDLRIHHTDLPTTGSRVECYLATADATANAAADAAADAEACQHHLLWLAPLPGVPARLLINGDESDSTAVAWRVERSEDGYQLEALIKLPALGLRGKRLRAELALGAAKGAGAQAERAAWQHSSDPLHDAASLAVLRLR